MRIWPNCARTRYEPGPGYPTPERPSPMSGKAQPEAGTRFEHRILSTLRSYGYWATRTPASRSAVDIVAVRPDQVLFVQCKVDGRLDPDGWNALYDLRLAGGLPILVERLPGYRLAWWRLTAYKIPGTKTPQNVLRESFSPEPMSLVLAEYAPARKDA